MDLIPILSTVIFIITIITFIVAVASYIVFRLKERRKGQSAPLQAQQPVASQTAAQPEAVLVSSDPGAEPIAGTPTPVPPPPTGSARRYSSESAEPRPIRAASRLSSAQEAFMRSLEVNEPGSTDGEYDDNEPEPGLTPRRFTLPNQSAQANRNVRGNDNNPTWK